MRRRKHSGPKVEKTNSEYDVRELVRELVRHDIEAQRNEYFFAPPAAVSSWLDTALEDTRDKPIAFLFFNISVITLPAAALVFHLQSAVAGLCYIVMNLVAFEQRFFLSLHYSSHRRLFKPRFWLLNQWAPMVLCPLFGLAPGAYNLHHCVMHHIENNVFPWDVSSTEPYQRDNFLHFLHYWLRFLFAVWVELPYYAYRRGRKAMAARSAATFLLYFSFMFGMHGISSVGTTWVFLVPHLVSSFLLMLGNWSQHIFLTQELSTIDARGSRSSFHSTYNCIDHPSNQRAFNDGYHIEHHLQSRRHWSEMPQHSLDSWSDYVKEDAIVFKNMAFMGVGLCVFFGRYNRLCNAFLDTKSPRRSNVEIEKMLRSRLKPVVRLKSGL